jgi:hypothetical protein
MTSQPPRAPRPRGLTLPPGAGPAPRSVRPGPERPGPRGLGRGTDQSRRRAGPQAPPIRLSSMGCLRVACRHSGYPKSRDTFGRRLPCARDSGGRSWIATRRSRSRATEPPAGRCQNRVVQLRNVCGYRRAGYNENVSHLHWSSSRVAFDEHLCPPRPRPPAGAYPGLSLRAEPHPAGGRSASRHARGQRRGGQFGGRQHKRPLRPRPLYSRDAVGSARGSRVRLLTPDDLDPGGREVAGLFRKAVVRALALAQRSVKTLVGALR